MEYRSTNADGRFVHYGGALVAGVSFGSGIELNPNSSGANPNVMPAGDETNKGITLKGKGTGTVTIGDSSNSLTVAAPSVVFSSGAVVQVGSTAPWAGFVRQISTGVATPDFNSTGTMNVISTVTMTGVNSSHFIVCNPINLSTAVHITRAWAGSTAGSVNLHWLKDSTVTIAVSTATVRLLAIRF